VGIANVASSRTTHGRRFLDGATSVAITFGRLHTRALVLRAQILIATGGVELGAVVRCWRGRALASLVECSVHIEARV